MGWIWRTAYRFLKMSPGRTILTSLGVALGVALAATLFLMSHSARTSMDQQIATRFGDYDMQLGYKKNGNYLTGEQVRKIVSLNGVSSTSKVLIPYVYPIPKEVFKQPAYWGVENDSPDMKSYKVLKGRYPIAGAEVAVSAAFARRAKIDVGDRVAFPFPPFGSKTVIISGILEPRISGGGGNTAFFPLAWLQETTHLTGKVNLLQLDLAKGVNKTSVAHQVKELYPDIKIDTRSYVDRAYKQLDTFRPMAYGLGTVALLAGAILVMGSFYLSVTARFDYWAILRALGSTPRQIVAVITAEALTVGILGSAIGVLAGIVFSSVTVAFMKRWLQLGETALVLSPFYLTAVFGAGVVLAVLGALLPALSVRKVPPAQALRPGLPQPVCRERSSAYIGVVLLVAGIITGLSSRWVPKGDGGPPLLVGGIGGLIMCIGLLWAVPHLTTLVVNILTLPAKCIWGIEATLAARNVIRHRQRSAFAIATLALGIILALSANIFMGTVSKSVEANLKKSLPTDLIVRIPYTAAGYLDPELALQITRIQGVERAAAVGSYVEAHLKNFDFSRVDKRWLEFADANSSDPFERNDVEIYPADTVALKKLLSLSAQGVSLNRDLKPGEAVMTLEMANRLGLKLGDVLHLEKGRNISQKLKIVALLDDYPMVRGVPFLFVNRDWGMKAFGVKGDNMIFVKLKPLAGAGQIENKIASLIRDNPAAEYVSYQKASLEQQNMFARQLLLIRALIAVVLAIACIGLVNAIVSGLQDRRWETGVIKAIGADPGQLLRGVAMEGMFLGVGGGLIGITGGSVLAYFLLHALKAKAMLFPWGNILILLLISVVIGSLASVTASLWVRRVSPTGALRAGG